MLKKNYDPIVQQAFIEALLNNNVARVLSLITDDLVDVNKIIVKSRDPIIKNERPLCFAVKMGYFEIFNILLSVPDIDINLYSDNTWRTPLAMAISQADLGKVYSDMVKALLIDPRININAQSKHGSQILSYVTKSPASVGVLKEILKHPKIDLSQCTAFFLNAIDSNYNETINACLKYFLSVAINKPEVMLNALDNIPLLLNNLSMYRMELWNELHKQLAMDLETAPGLLHKIHNSAQQSLPTQHPLYKIFSNAPPQTIWSSIISVFFVSDEKNILKKIAALLKYDEIKEANETTSLLHK